MVARLPVLVLSSGEKFLPLRRHEGSEVIGGGAKEGLGGCGLLLEAHALGKHPLQAVDRVVDNLVDGSVDDLAASPGLLHQFGMPLQELLHLLQLLLLPLFQVLWLLWLLLLRSLLRVCFLGSVLYRYVYWRAFSLSRHLA